MTLPLADYLLHFLIGLGGAVSARCAVGLCHHRRHQIAVGFVLLAVETVVTVTLVG